MVVVVLVCGGLGVGLTEAQPPTRVPRSDAAFRAAVVVARRAAWVPSYRAREAWGTWVTDASARWSIRPERECMEGLAALGVPARRQPFTPTPVPTPVALEGPIDDVRFEKTRDVPLIVACELAARLPILARVLRAHGVRAADVMSAYRRDPVTSFHNVGLGLDLSAFTLDDGTRVEVAGSFEPTPDVATCDAPPPRTASARLLLDLACALHATRAFQTVLTPNYPGHDDHLHLDVRPDDSRLYVR
jgi:hypothetical protein